MTETYPLQLLFVPILEQPRSLSFDVTEEDLRKAFEEYGQVESVTIATHRDSGKPRGFGFVEMSVQGEAEAAIADLNGTELKGRELRVEEARLRT